MVSGEFLLEKFPGKGGWTYVALPDVKPDKSNPFGWIRVKGKIDNFEFKQYHLMPMGTGHLFLPVKAQIRKQIKKKEGDKVMISIYHDHSIFEIPKEIEECLEFESTTLLERFRSQSESEKKAYLNWIYEAKTEEEKAKRIVGLINDLNSRIKNI